MAEEIKLSFLESDVLHQMEPSLFDHEAYFPGKIFWKTTRAELCKISSPQIEELKSKGWSIINEKDFLALSSQLFLLLVVDLQDGQKSTIWAREKDQQHARDYPVVLVHETTLDATENDLKKMVFGSHALIYKDDAIYRYSLRDLDQKAKTIWKKIEKGFQPQSLRLSNQTPNGEMVDGSVLLEQFHQYYSNAENQLREAYEAAGQLAEYYWHRHVHNPVKPATLPKGLADLPAVYRQSRLSQGLLIPASLGLEAALLAMSNAVEGGKGWQHTDEGEASRLGFELMREEGAALVSLQSRPLQPTDTQDDINRQLWHRVNSYSDLDGDLLLALLAQAVTIGADERGAVWITASDILSYRGMTPKTHTTASGEKRDAGHRQEDIRDISASIERLRQTHVTVQSWKEPKKKGGRRRVVRQESYLISISDFLEQESEGKQQSPLQIAWYYRPGTCLGKFPTSKQMRIAWLLQKALHYNPAKEKWEKRLARYFLFHLRFNDLFGGAAMRRSIGTMLQEASLPINEGDPEKTKTRFEQAMHQLQVDGHISDWSEQTYQEAMRQLPSRGWLKHWLDYELEISASPLLDELAEDMRAKNFLPG